MGRSLLAVALATLVLAVGLRAQTELGGGVWETHLIAGAALWNGELPFAPAYPMWGYSLFAAPLGAAVVVPQLALLAGLLAWWLPALALDTAGRRSLFSITNPSVLVVVLAPWILLSISYYSNSMSCLLGWLGAWGLLEAARRDAHVGWFALAGLLVGLAANFRTENLLLGVFLASGFAVSSGLQGAWLTGAKRAAAILGATLFAMVPWLLYTQHALGTARLTSTNGGAVMYLGLGVLPDNPWGIEADDRYVTEIALAEVGTHAFTAPAHHLLSGKFREAVAEHPDFFARRVLRGWRLALTQGVELPPLRKLMDFSPADLRLADYLNERAKSALGLAVNHRELEEYRAAGLSFDDLSLRHYAFVLIEYSARAAFAAIFLVLLLASVRAAWRLGPKTPATWVWLAYLAAWLLVAGGIQTLPRHTTWITPALVTVVALEAARRRAPTEEPAPG